MAAIAAVSEDAAPGAVLDSVRAAVDADGALPRRYGLRFHEHRMRSPGLISFLSILCSLLRVARIRSRASLTMGRWQECGDGHGRKSILALSHTHKHTHISLTYLDRRVEAGTAGDGEEDDSRFTLLLSCSIALAQVGPDVGVCVRGRGCA